MQPLAWLVAAMLACSAHAFARPSAYLGLPRSLAVTTVAPPVRARASISASSHTEVEEEEEVSFEKEVLKNARVTESWAGEGAWVLVTREFGEFEEEEAENEGTAIEGPDVTITSRGEAGAGEVEIEVDGEDDEEGVILVQDPSDDKYLFTLFSSEEDATRYLYMLLDEDIDSESSYAAAWYTSDEIAELLDADIKLALI